MNEIMLNANGARHMTDQAKLKKNLPTIETITSTIEDAAQKGEDMVWVADGSMTSYIRTYFLNRGFGVMKSKGKWKIFW